MNQHEISALISPAVWFPGGLEEAWQIKQEHGESALFIAGGTLLQTNWKKGIPSPEHLISLERIKEMQGISQHHAGKQLFFRIGALTTLEHCRQYPDFLNKCLPIAEAAKNIASPAVRNKATIGGNIAHGFGDAIPALLAMDADVLLFNGKKRITVKLLEYLEKKSEWQNAILVSIDVNPFPSEPHMFFFYRKMGFREAFFPSILTVSGYCSLHAEKGGIEIRLAAGGANTPPKRLLETEKIITAACWKEKDWENIHSSIKEELHAETDHFASAEYKRLAAANLIVSELASIPE